MSVFLLINQLLNFVAPAAGIALGVVLLSAVFSRFLRSNKTPAHSLSAQAAIVFIAGVGLLLVGLVLFGRDGKIATYALLALGVATCQWVLLRGWKA